MAAWYVDFTSGNDITGTGTELAPYKTISALVAAQAIADGDSIRYEGESTTPEDLTGLIGVTIAPKGTGRRHFTGARVATGTPTQVPATNAWEYNIGTGRNVEHVTINYGQGRNRWGQFKGFLVAAISAIACASTPGTFHYDSGTGVLRVHRAGGASPVNQDVRWVQGGINLIVLRNCQRVTWGALEGTRCTDEAAGKGNLIRLVEGCEDCTIYVRGSDDMGHHHLVVADGSCKGNKFVGVGKGRMQGHAAGGIGAVFFTTRNADDGNVFENLTCYCTSFLDEVGIPINTTATYGAFYAHTNGTAKWGARGVVGRKCRVYFCHDIGAGSFDFGGADTINPASDAAALSANNYGVVYEDCRSEGGCGSVRFDASVAWVRCRFNYPRAVLKGTTGVISDAVSTARYYLYAACEILANLDHATPGASIMRAWANAVQVFVHSTVLDTGGTVTNGERAIINPLNNTSRVIARGSLLGFLNAGTFRKGYKDGSNEPSVASNADYQGCAWLNVSTGQFGANAAFNTQAEWLASIDTNAQFLSGSHLREPEESAHLLEASSLRTNRITGLGFTQAGINGPNAGVIGCYQYPATPLAGVSGSSRFAALPLWVVTLQTGSHGNNHRGQPPDYVEDPTAYMEAALAMGRTLGFPALMTHVEAGIEQDEYYHQRTASTWSLVSGTVYEHTLASDYPVNVVTYNGEELGEVSSQAALGGAVKSWNQTGTSLRVQVGANPTGQTVRFYVNDIYYSIDHRPGTIGPHESFWSVDLPAMIRKYGYQRWTRYIGPVHESRRTALTATPLSPLVDWYDMDFYLGPSRGAGCRSFCYDFLFGADLAEFIQYHNAKGEECWSEPPLVTGTEPNRIIDATNAGKTLWALESWYLGFAEVDSFRVPSGCVAFCIFDYTNFSQAQLAKRIAQGFTIGFLYGPYSAPDLALIAKHVQSVVGGASRRTIRAVRR